jgi:A/G-specific adenine glycosylase
MPTASSASSPSASDIAALRRALIAWFRRGHRDMPWRRTKDPYAIWVSEIMLQQTRVEAVRGYYTRWMSRLPTVRALAAAPLDEVLGLWSGLGYYARARNLKAAAEFLVAEESGELPRDPLRLRAMPGVGEYTAGAIASIAFGLPEPILDGNVARVLCRVFFIDAPPEAASTRARLWALARALVPKSAASDFNQAMMELGATVCTPRAPDCPGCPIAKRCLARAAGRQEELPRKRQKRATPEVEQIALVAVAGRRVLLGQRPTRGLWGGLWEPPCMSPAREESKHFSRRFGLTLRAARLAAPVAHELTHRRYRFTPLVAQAKSTGAPTDREGFYTQLRWFEERALAELGLAAWARRVLDETLRQE